MNRTFKIVKWQLSRSKKGLITFYLISVAMVIITILLQQNGIKKFLRVNGEATGLGIASMIFLFISGLNYFKEEFKFLQANSINRSMQFKTTIITFLALSVFMALINMVSGAIVNNFIPYRSLFERVYNDSNVFSVNIWTSSLHFFAITLGWFITLLYYRASKTMRVLISVSPAFLIAVFAMVEKNAGVLIYEGLVKIFGRMMGIADGNSYISVFSFLGLSVISLIFSYFLIRKAPLKA